VKNKISPVCFGVIIIAVLLVSSCKCSFLGAGAGKEAEVCFVLPDKYEGNFYVVLDKKNGVDPEIKDRCVVLRVSSTGTIFLKSFDSINNVLWENHYVAYENGALIKSSAYFNDPTSTNQHVLWAQGERLSPEYQIVRFFVGTLKQRYEEKEKPYPEALTGANRESGK